MGFITDLTLLDSRDPVTGLRVCRWRECSNLIPHESRKQFYCSDECRNKTYRYYIWDYVREDVWIRDGRRCLYPDCGRAITLNEAEIHHIVSIEELRRIIGRNFRGNHRDYRRALFEAFVDKRNLVTLCEACHNKVKHYRPKKKVRDDREKRLSFIRHPYWPDLTRRDKNILMNMGLFFKLNKKLKLASTQRTLSEFVIEGG